MADIGEHKRYNNVVHEIELFATVHNRACFCMTIETQGRNLMV